MISYRHYVSGSLIAVIYEFEKAGESIPEHAHSEDLAHNIVILKGAVSFESHGAIQELEAGTMFDFNGSQSHRIQALVPGTRIANFLLRPTPQLAVDLKDMAGIVHP